MVTNVANVLSLSPGRAVARPTKKLASEGPTLINKVLDSDVVRAMVDADRFTTQVQDAGQQHLELDQETTLHRMWLPEVVRADEVRDVLSDITRGSMLTQAEAGAMLQYLFGAMGKRRDDEAAAKLMACVDIFSPASNALGPALGLWESAPTHPVILAITIKQLMSEKTFEPAEAELREALEKVEQRLSAIGGWVWKWLEKLAELDLALFNCDRAAWDQAYVNVSSKVVLAMREWSEMCGEGPCEDKDEDGNPEYAPSPRWQALDDLVKAKQVLKSPRQAACGAKPAKRTRKPKLVEADQMTGSNSA